MALTAIPFTTPVGRLVWGSLYKPQTKDADGKPRVVKDGPNKGQPNPSYSFGLAIPKIPGQHWATYPRLETKPGDPSWGEAVWAAAHQYMQNAGQLRDFAFKVTDGDDTRPNKRNKRPCDQEGYAGHWVLSFSSSFPPKIYNSDGSQMIVEADAVKTGYYVQVAAQAVGNMSTQNPGVYLNHSMVAMRGYGPEIFSGPDPSAAGFGGGALPAGASMQPPAGAMPAAPPPGHPAAATPPPPGYGAPQPPAAYPPPPQAPQPHAGILTPPAPGAAYAPPVPPQAAYAPPPPPAAAPDAPAPFPPGYGAPPAPPPAPAGPQLTAAAGNTTWAAMQAQGWTEAVARQHGMIV